MFKKSEFEKVQGRTLYTCNFIADRDFKDKKILNIGCGNGWFEIYVLKKKPKNIIGIDIKKDIIKIASSRVKSKKVTFIVANALELPFKNQSFDTVCAWEVIEHLPAGCENKMMSEINRVLKKSGIFYLSTPFASPYSTLFDPAWWLIKHRHYKKKLLINIAKNYNFSIKDVQTKGKWWEILSLLDLYISKWILHRSMLFEDFISNKNDKEFIDSKSGFTNLFLKMVKNKK